MLLVPTGQLEMDAQIARSIRHLQTGVHSDAARQARLDALIAWLKQKKLLGAYPDVGNIQDGRDFCAEEGIEQDVNIKVKRLDEPKVTHAPGSNPVKLPLKDVSLTPLSVDDSPCTHESWEEPLANDMLSITSDDLSSADSSSSETSSDIEWLERLVTF